VALVVWGAPAAGRYFERERSVPLGEALRPLLPRLARVWVRICGAAGVIGGALIAIFPHAWLED